MTVGTFLNNLYKRGELGNTFFFITVLLFAISLPFAEFMISILAGVVLLQALVFFNPAKIQWKDPILLLIVSVFGLYLLGCWFTNDIHTALYELKKTMFWLLVPMGVAWSRRLNKRQFTWILMAFIIAVVLSSLVSTGRLLFLKSLASNFREAHFVSHITFSLQVAFSVFILLFFILWPDHETKIFPRWLLLILALWLLAFLFMLKSMIGLIAFYFSAFVLLLIIFTQYKRKKWRSTILIMAVVVFVLPLGYLAKVAYDFFTPRDRLPENGIAYTLNGNAYTFDIENRQKENGYHVYWYFCEPEMIKEWNSRSSIPYNEPGANAYPVGSTLIRYLTAKGLKKDSAGVATLSEQDIKNIQLGIANPVFARSVLSIYPRVYETIWEIDNYFRTGDPNRQSLSQRIEFSKAAWLLIQKKPLFGIGTGNYPEAYRTAHVEMQSKLNPELYGVAHNQYLNYWVKFGLAGLLWIIFVLIYAIVRKKQGNNLLLQSFLLIFFFANFGENNFETHVGLSFFLLFFSLFIWHWPEIDKPNPETIL